MESAYSGREHGELRQVAVGHGEFGTRRQGLEYRDRLLTDLFGVAIAAGHPK